MHGLQEAGRMAWTRRVTWSHWAPLWAELLSRAGRVGRSLRAGLWSECCRATYVLNPANFRVGAGNRTGRAAVL